MAKRRKPSRRPVKTRTESDAFGPLEIPADKLWGAQTERSLHNFRIGTERMPLAIVHALALFRNGCTLDSRSDTGSTRASIAALRWGTLKAVSTHMPWGRSRGIT